MSRRQLSSWAPSSVVRAGLTLRSLVRRTTDLPLPPEGLLFDLSMGFAVTRMLAAVVKLGIADEIGAGSATASQIAARRGLDADTVHRVLRALAVHDVVALDGAGRFSLTRTGRLLRVQDPASLAPWLLYLDEESTQRPWSHIDQGMRDGKPPFPAVNGSSMWEYFADHPNEGSQFGAAMRRLTAVDLPAIVGCYPWPAHGVVCDVAGGIGTLLAGVLQARAGLRGILIDHPDVLTRADDYLQEHGVRDRVQTVAGDIFAGFTATANVYVLKDVLHDWDDERSAAILRSVRAAAPVGSKLVVIERDQPANTALFPTSMIDVHMLTQTDGGRQRSTSELHRLLREANFEPGSTYRTLGMSMVSGTAM